MRKPSVADELFQKVGAVVAENRELKRKIKAVRHHASAGLHQAASEGAARWRDALDSILQVTGRQ